MAQAPKEKDTLRTVGIILAAITSVLCLLAYGFFISPTDSGPGSTLYEKWLINNNKHPRYCNGKEAPAGQNWERKEWTELGRQVSSCKLVPADDN